VATISRLLKITGLFCQRALEKRGYSAKETYDYKEPTNRSHPIEAKIRRWKEIKGNRRRQTEIEESLTQFDTEILSLSLSLSLSLF